MVKIGKIYSILGPAMHRKDLIVVFAAILAFVAFQSDHAVWNGDSLLYAYMWPESYSPDNQLPRIESFGDIVVSQYNHYQLRNGRSLVHAIVQVFCGLTSSHAPFVIANTIVWAIFLSLFLICVKSGRKEASGNLTVWDFVISFALLELVLPPYYDPAFQINYVWVGAIVLLWLNLFFKGADYFRWVSSNGNTSKFKNALSRIILILFSFVAGWSNEAFSFPVAAAITTLALIGKLRLDRRQTAMLVWFAIGALMILCSPGSWNRMEDTANAVGLFYRFAFAFIYLWPLWLMLIIFAFNRTTESLKIRGFLLRNEVAVTIIVYSILMTIMIGNYQNRALTMGNIAVACMIVNLLYKNRYKVFFRFLIIVFWICQTVYGINGQNELRDYMQVVREKAAGLSENDSIIWFSNEEMYLWGHEGVGFLDCGPDNLSAKTKIRAPEQLRNIDWNKDTNAVINLGHSRYLIVESKLRPMNAVVKRKVHLGMVSVPLPSRKIDLAHGDVCYIMETEKWRAGVYVPRNELLQADVRMQLPESRNNKP